MHYRLDRLRRRLGAAVVGSRGCALMRLGQRLGQDEREQPRALRAAVGRPTSPKRGMTDVVKGVTVCAHNGIKRRAMHDYVMLWNAVALELNRRDHTGKMNAKNQKGP